MNFLAEVLATNEKTQMSNIKEKIPRIISQKARLKCEVKNYMVNAHVNLKVMKKKSNNLLAEANRLNGEMKELNDQIECLTKRELEDSKNELVNLTADLKESMYAINVVTQLVQIHDFVEKAKELMHRKKYLEAITNISFIKQILKDIPKDEQLDIIQTISVSMTIEHESILNDAGKIWTESVVTDKKIVDDDVILSIKINTSQTDDLEQSIKALCFENTFVFELQCLSNFLMNEVFVTIVNNNCIVETSEKDVFSILTIKVNKSLGKLPYDKVFNNIRTVIDFLSVTINFQIKKDLLLLGYVGQKISEPFCEQLIKNCLADTVPSTPEGLQKYNEVVVEIESLQQLFTECQFFNNDNKSILEYANNVDVLFANKTCQVYLEKAKSILKKDLHDMIEVGCESEEEEAAKKKSVYVFPKCYISKNVNEYLNLVRKILDQANSSSDMCAGRLVYTAEQVIGFYYKLVPEFHKKLLETIPQQVALFHNNCMYLAHELLTVNKYYHDQKANVVVREESFNSHVDLLRTAGTESFLAYMRTQIKQIEDILKDSELMKLGQTDKLDPNCEKSIRQCLRQLELLKTVWQKVLSYEIYNKTIGELLSAFVDFLIKIVIDVEDISADNCTLLVDVYGIVKNRAPKLFSEPKEINLYAKRWYKFNELILLLNSSLTDINDRWADGKGPLAVEFKPEEVKGLVRALFQNTDRRSAVLARIV